VAPSKPILWITLLVMLLGLLGSVLPGLPGVPLIFASALVYAYVTDFEFVGGWAILLLALVALLAFVADFLGRAYGAWRFVASNWGTAGGAIGGIVGTLAGALFVGVGALFGLLAGTIGGVFVGEHLQHKRRGAAPATNPGTPATPSGGRDWRGASRAAGGVLVGYLLSTVAQGFLGLLGVVLFTLGLFY
jgi:uncharacterized protein YqgC (DUF456 family)